LKRSKHVLFLKKKNQKDFLSLGLRALARSRFTVMAGLEPVIHA
jgi:hypothetical protein